MKHTKLLILLLLGAVRLSAAEPVPLMQLDSIITEVEEPTQYKSKQEFAVDATGQVEVRSAYQWNPTSRKWVGSYKYEQTNNEQGREIAYINYSWRTDVNNWVATWKSRSTYNSEGRRIRETSDRWDRQAMRWEKSYTYEQAYNDRGQTTLYAVTAWDNKNNQWVGQYKYVYTYNENYKETAYAYYTWNNSTADWTGQNQQITQYTRQGRVSETIDQFWDATREQWTNYSKTAYTYDDPVYYWIATRYSWNPGANQWEPTTRNENGNVQDDSCTISRVSTWNPDQSAWELSSKDSTSYSQDGRMNTSFTFNYVDGSVSVDGEKREVVYDEAGNNTRRTTWHWNSTDSTWTYEGDQRYEYDAFGNMTSTMSYTWSTAKNTWIGVKKQVATYDANHLVDALKAFNYDVNDSYGGQLPTSIKEYHWYEQYNMWYFFPDKTTQYFYSAFSPLDALFSDKKLEVYLNPVTDIMTINDEALLKGGAGALPPVRLYDVRGGLLLTTSLRVIDLSRFPDGMFVVTVNGRSCRVMKR